MSWRTTRVERLLTYVPDAPPLPVSILRIASGCLRPIACLLGSSALTLPAATCQRLLMGDVLLHCGRWQRSRRARDRPALVPLDAAAVAVLLVPLH